MAWNLEAVWMPTDKAQLACRVEGADDYQDDLMRYGIAASYGVFSNSVIALEYLHSVPDNDPKSHTFIGQLAFES